MSLLAPEQQRFRFTALGCEFTVYGRPQPGGSKRAFTRKNKESGKVGVVVVDMNEKRLKPWKNEIEMVASSLIGTRPMYEGPLMLVVDFYMPRPKAHFGVHGVKHRAPRYPAVRPDTTKLLRPLEDALSGILWRDDAQIVEQIVRKRYGDPPRAEVRVAVMVT